MYNFENIDSQNYITLFKCWLILWYHLKKITSDPIRKIFKYWESLSCFWWQIKFFQKPNFCLEAWILSLTTNMSDVFPKAAGLLCSFLRICLPILNFQYSVCLFVILYKNDILWGENLLGQLANQTIGTISFPWDNYHTSVYSLASYVCFLFCHTEY